MFIRANIDLLVWDSNFFGRRIGLVTFNNSAPYLTSDRFTEFALVQVKVASNEIKQMDVLNSLGFQLVIGETQCCYRLATSNYGNEEKISILPNIKVRIAEISDIPKLCALAAQAFTFSRFRSPWFSSEERSRFYAQWVKNAVLSNFDNICLIADGLKSPEGLVTLRIIDEQTARIGILAVSPTARGKNIGKLLYHAAIDWCRTKGFSKLLVVTQTNNIPALKLYLTNGANICYVLNWLYREPNDSI